MCCVLETETAARTKVFLFSSQDLNQQRTAHGLSEPAIHREQLYAAQLLDTRAMCHTPCWLCLPLVFLEMREPQELQWKVYNT